MRDITRTLYILAGEDAHKANELRAMETNQFFMLLSEHKNKIKRQEEAIRKR